MTTKQNAQVVVQPNGLLSICAWCLPADVLAKLHQEYQCTDSICASCFEAQFKKAH